MPYTASQLTTFYTNANLGITPTAAEALLIQAYAQQNQAGSLTDAQTVATILTFSQDKTDVALATYQFFTGASPSLGGLAYLVHGGGNPNDLSSAYYTGFNKENRYYNFAINLATGAGAGAANFAANYGSVTFAQAVQAAYEIIVGSVNVGAANAAAAEAAIIAQQSYFAAIAAQRAPGTNQDLATKAIAIGYILEEAQKADVGYYAKAIDAFGAQLAVNGTATTGNLVALYDGRTYTLTNGVDTVNGTSFADSLSGTFNGNATTTTWNQSDVINGNGGADVFTGTDLGTGGVFTVNGTLLPLSNIATVTLNSTEGLNVDATTWAGVTALNVNSTAFVGGQTVTALGTTAVTVNETDSVAGAVTGNLLTINGGSTVTVNETLKNATVNTLATAGAVTINGVAGTTAVTVNQAAPVAASATKAGVADGAVVINDVNAGSATKAGSITSVTLSNFASATINDNALANLTLSGVGGGVTINDTLTTPTATTLNLNVNGFTGAGISDTNNGIKTLNVVTGATGSSLAAFLDTGLKSVNVSGSSNFALGTALNASVNSLTVTGGAGLSGAAGGALDISGTGVALFAPTSTGTINVKLGATQAFTGGAGTDIITISADATKAIVGGSATNNELILNAAASTFLGVGATTASNVSGFQILGVGAGSSGSYDVSKFAGVTALDVQATGGSVIFTKVAAGTTLSIDNTISSGVTYQAVDATGLTDSVNVYLGTSASTAGITTGGQLTFQDSTLAGIGNVTINSLGVASTTAPYAHTISTLNDSGLVNLTFTGAIGTTVANLVDFASTVSISNASGGTVVDTIGAWSTTQLANLTLNGNVALSLTDSLTSGVTINGGTDNANVTLALGGATVGKTDLITLGNGNNVINDATATGTVVINVGTGANTIFGGSGTNTITVGASGTNAESIILKAANSNVVNLGAHTGVDSITVAAHDGLISAVISGLNVGATSADQIIFAGDALAAGPVMAVTTTQINTYANTNGLDATLLSTALKAVLDTSAHGGAGLAQHGIAEFVFQGNTYLVEQANATGTITFTGDTVIQLVGVQNISASSIAAGGVLSLHG